MFVILKRKQKAVIEAACDAVKAFLPKRMSGVCRNLSAHTAVSKATCSHLYARNVFNDNPATVISTTTAIDREIIKPKFPNSTRNRWGMKFLS
ncbi:hypothetical protein T10_3306 [Trichinella papuae]|uniref:Uncharacterized protein n=1 Tax=Trichinella papuae TaxID=268474 RepID=A0A0V1N0X4_9BILA|nr:hypothetical protein T10_3306 [Trichinella papuae]